MNEFSIGQLAQSFVQTKGRAAAKTFVQTFLSLISVTVVLYLAGMQDRFVAGEPIALDLGYLQGALLAGLYGAVAAVLSLAMNWSTDA
ncbi:MAG: hypothetical protein M9947_15585 [Thermomicrobiales bacterium]|nr:hypothetical protein [Thermomicrobiales bacterium]